jgi:opacity protein-like surface antigen
MKQTFISASIVAMLSTGAIAGNIDTPTADSVIAPPPTSTVTDWSGAYVGLSYGFASGDYSFTQLNGVNRDMDDGSLTQLFGGYQVQRGALVYGGELAFGSAQDTVVTGFPTAQVTDMIDLKAASVMHPAIS